MNQPTETPQPREHGHSHHHGHSHGHSHAVAHGHDHGPIDPDLAESREGVRVLMISLVILAITAIAQAVVVYFTGSVALLADTIHNVGDALTAVPLAIAFILSRRAPTARFPWGLGRTEDLAGIIIVVLIGFSAVVAFVQSVDRLIHPQAPSFLVAGIAAGIVGFIGNEAVALYRIRQGKKMHSAALIADGMHARVDGFTSLGVAAGLALVAAGFERADPITGIIISVIIARIAWGAARDVGIRLLDGIEHEHAEPIETVVRNHLGDEAVRSVRGRWHGHVIHVEVFLDPAHTERVNTAGGAAALEHALREAGTRARQVALVVDRSPAEIIGQP